jgi:hypothetical protein
LRIIVLELPASAAHVATDPNRVYYVGAGYNPAMLPGLLFFLTRPCLRPAGAFGVHHDMLDGLRQGLVRHCDPDSFDAISHLDPIKSPG